MSIQRLLAVTLAISSLAVTTCGAALAQSSEPPLRPKRTNDPEQFYHAPTTPNGKTVVLPMGTTFSGRIDRTISSERSKNGQEFNIIIDSPVLVNGTDVVIPEGANIVGEVVDAMPASQVPVQPWEKSKKYMIRGKLRVKISGLRTPDGTMYPMVATLTGEVHNKYDGFNNFGPPIGTSVAYMGSTTSFESADANRMNALARRYQKGGPGVMSRKDFMKDEVMGMGFDGSSQRNVDTSQIRSLVLRKRDYFIYNGSPLTIKLTSPFKIGIGSPTLGVPVGQVEDAPQENVLPPPSTEREERNAGNPVGGSSGGRQAPPQRSGPADDSF